MTTTEIRATRLLILIFRFRDSPFAGKTPLFKMRSNMCSTLKYTVLSRTGIFIGKEALFLPGFFRRKRRYPIRLLNFAAMLRIACFCLPLFLLPANRPVEIRKDDFSIKRSGSVAEELGEISG